MALVRERHPREIFSEDGSRIDDLVAGLLEGRRVATAESCTAGLLAARLTDRPGSSAYVEGGVVAYANEAKADLLGVDPALIEAHGAVSEEVAEAMAAGRSERFGADTAVAITGIAAGRGVTRSPGSCGASGFAMGGRSRGGRSCPATAPTSASARPRWQCTCCAGRSRAWRTASPERSPCAHVRGARPTRGRAGGARRVARHAGGGPARPASGSGEALHVTLAFLGWQDEAAADAIVAATFAARPERGAAPLLTPSAVRPLPPRDPRLFALDSRTRSAARARCGRPYPALRAGGWYRPEKRPSGRTSPWRASSGGAPRAAAAGRSRPASRSRAAHALPLDTAPAGRPLRAARTGPGR